MNSYHDPSCRWPIAGPPCRKFSTDGTLLGAHIAHTMGTVDEEEIAESGKPNIQLTGMPEEQKDWEEDDE